MKTEIDIARLHLLLDRAADAHAAALTARTAETDAVQAAAGYRGSDEAHRAALQASAARRKTASAVANRRASLWAEYSTGLRTAATKRGVQL